MNTSDEDLLYWAKDLQKRLLPAWIFMFIFLLGSVALISLGFGLEKYFLLGIGIPLFIPAIVFMIIIHKADKNFHDKYGKHYNHIILSDAQSKINMTNRNGYICGPIEFCDNISTLKILNGIFTKNVLREINYKDILGVDLLIDNQSQLKGGLGSAVIGGVVFGGVGAIAGSIIGKTTKNYVNSLTVKLTVASGNPCEMINLISFKTETNTEKYKSAFDDAQRIVSKIQVILNSNNKPDTSLSTTTIKDNTSIDNNSYSNTISGTFVDIKPERNDKTTEKDIPSLLREYKTLLDEGIITPEEFESKKKELLNIK